MRSMTTRKLLVDAFQVTNELDLIKFRLTYLHNLVDKVVIAESNMTHSGDTKPLYFTNFYPQLESRFSDKIEIVYVPLDSNMTTWEREQFTREYLRNHLFDKYFGSRFILSDVDEIPSIDQVNRLLNVTGIFHFHTPTYFRRLNWKLIDGHSNWARGVMGTVTEKKLVNAGRYDKSLAKIGGSPGAHFSYLGFNSKKLELKLKSFAHHEEFEIDYWKSEDILNYCDKYVIDHLGRSRTKGYGILKIVNLDENLVIQAAEKFMPKMFEHPSSLPGSLSRFLASIKLSVFVNNRFLSKLVRKKYDFHTFVNSSNLRIIFFVFCETCMSITAPIYHRIRTYFKRNLK